MPFAGDNKKCNVRESNPGHTLGKRRFYHYTNIAFDLGGEKLNLKGNAIMECIRVPLARVGAVSMSETDQVVELTGIPEVHSKYMKQEYISSLLLELV